MAVPISTCTHCTLTYTHTNTHTHTHTHTYTHTHVRMHKAKSPAATKQLHWPSETLGCLGTTRALRSQCTRSSTWTIPISKTWTAVWHLLPQLLPGTHWCYSWVDWSIVSKVSCTRKQQQHQSGHTRNQPTTFWLVGWCPDHLSKLAHTHVRTHMHIYMLCYTLLTLINVMCYISDPQWSSAWF